MVAIRPVVMVADETARIYAESTASGETESGGPTLHATKEMRRLATPWNVAMARADLVDSATLSPGIILDPACGSAMQLAAFCTTLNRPGLGVELSGAVAPLASVNLARTAEWANQEWGESSRILWGNGVDSAQIISTYWENVGENHPIALLHVDPARPTDAQNHTLDEMQPRLGELLHAWAPHLPRNPGLILDLSPRLSNHQRTEVDAIVSDVWPNVPTTWQWMTQGRGRIDRLSLWIGAVADSQPNRLIRLGKDGGFSGIITGESESAVSNQTEVEIGEHLTIADPCLISSGLSETWKNTASMSNPRWNTITGRRPILISSEPILSTYHELHVSEETYDTTFSFVQIAGEVVAQIPALNFEAAPQAAQIAAIHLPVKHNASTIIAR